MKTFFNKKTTSKLLASLLVLIINFFYLPVQAASLSALSDTMSRINNSTASDHTIKFTTPTGVESSTDTITITMPTGFTIGSVDYTDIDLSHGASTGYETEETLAATAASGVWGAVFAGQVLTLTAPTNAAAGEITASDKVVVEIGLNASGGNAQITNHSTAGTYIVSIAGTFGDTGSLALAIADDDQFTVSAAVDPSLTFTLNDVAVDLGILSVSTVRTDTTTFTVNTNAASGYSVTAVEDGNLRTATTDVNDVADGTVTAGSEEYGMSTSKAGQTFAQTAGNAATAITGTAQQCASAVAPVSSDITTLTLHASIAGATPAGSYSHIVTLIASGNF